MESTTTFDLKYPVRHEDRQRWADFFMKCAKMIPTSKPSLNIAEHCEKYRVLPDGERYPGPFQLYRTPYMREILENMSPMSPIRETVIMKAAQLAMTTALESIICYYMGYFPADLLMVTSSADNYRRWVGRRLEPAINSYGYRELIRPQELRKSGKQTGDRLATKEYPGGQFDLVSALSAASLRALTKRIILIDEADGAKEQLDTGEGSYLDVAEMRAESWGDLAKVMIVSTPTLAGHSAIEKRYDLGDKRHWFVSCIHCGKFQVMIWPKFKGETVAGKLKGMYYECDYCTDAIFEHDKLEFLIGGHWEPTADPQKDDVRSYQLSGWYAPLGFAPWKRMYQRRQAAEGNPDKLRSFINLVVGMPYRDMGTRPKHKKIMEGQGTYLSGTVPRGVLFLTMTGDVQTGSADDPNNPPRLELEVCGHGADYRTWSIAYYRFEGNVKNIYDEKGAWGQLNDLAKKNKLTYLRDDGVEFPVRMVGIDATDGNMADIVFQFTRSWGSTYPLWNFSKLAKRKEEKGDEMTSSNLMRYRIKNLNGIILFQISTNYYKNHIYNNLHVRRQQLLTLQKPGFCDFPADYGERYFMMLTAEDKRADGSFDAGARRNEALDCRVYNCCLADIFLDNMVRKMREQYKTIYKKDELEALINRHYVIEYLTKELEMKKPDKNITNAS